MTETRIAEAKEISIITLSLTVAAKDLTSGDRFSFEAFCMDQTDLLRQIITKGNQSYILTTPAFQVLVADLNEFIANSISNGADKLSISCSGSGDNLTLTLEDNGLGVNKHKNTQLYTLLASQTLVTIDQLKKTEEAIRINSDKKSGELGGEGVGLLRPHTFLSSKEYQGKIEFKLTRKKSDDDFSIAIQISSNRKKISESNYIDFKSSYGEKISISHYSLSSPSSPASVANSFFKANTHLTALEINESPDPEGFMSDEIVAIISPSSQKSPGTQPPIT